MSVDEANLLYGGVDFPENFGPIDDPDFYPSFTEENTYRWYNRFNKTLLEIGEKEKGHTVLIVTHGTAYYWGQHNFGDIVTGLGNVGYAE